MSSTSNNCWSIELDYEPLTLKPRHAFGIAYGSSSHIYNVLVKLRWQSYEGLGEAAPRLYHAESAATVSSAFEQWAASGVLGFDPFAIEAIMQKLEQSITGNHAAKAAVEMALQDLVGKILGVPVYKRLGLAGMPAPMTDFTIGVSDLSLLAKKTEEAVQAGYPILKVKQGTSFDKEIILTVRKVAAHIPLRVDANGGWTPRQAIAMSHFLAEQGVEFIEQPLPKFAAVEDWRFVRQGAALPIFADESCMRAADAVRLSGAVDGVVVKLAKAGGISEALKLIHTARAQGMSVMLGMMVESSLGATAATQLAGLADYLDLDGALLLDFDPFVGAVYKDGYMNLPDGVGLGVVPS